MVFENRRISVGIFNYILCLLLCGRPQFRRYSGLRILHRPNTCHERYRHYVRHIYKHLLFRHCYSISTIFVFLSDVDFANMFRLNVCSFDVSFLQFEDAIQSHPDFAVPFFRTFVTYSKYFTWPAMFYVLFMRFSLLFGSLPAMPLFAVFRL